MAYTTINKSTDHFNTITYAGDGNSPRSHTGVGFQPDLLWIKNRSGGTAYEHRLMDSVRGSNKVLHSSNNAAETSEEYYTVGSFDSDGWTGRNGTGSQQSVVGGNDSGYNFVAWNWFAGGTAPSQTYTVKVVSDSGNKYRFDDFGTSAVTLDLQEGGTYTFDASDSSVSSHPFVLGTSSGTDGSYSTGVTYQLDGVSKSYSDYTSGFASATTRKLIITVAASAPTLYYNCSVHSGMGGAINTNSTHGSSNFSGTYQSLVSTNSTSGMSVVKFTGTGSSGSVGHGLGAEPGMIWVKNLGGTTNWTCYHKDLGTGKYIQLNTTNAAATASGYWATVDNNVFGVTSGHTTLNNNYIAYCFANKNGFARSGRFVSVGDDNGAFVYTGFKPSLVMIKPDVTDGWSNWYMFDTARDSNLNDLPLYSNLNTIEGYYGGSPASNYAQIDMLSNGFKIRRDGNWGVGGSGQASIYIAFGQSIVGSNNVPATAR